jgi:hypothetical protein
MIDENGDEITQLGGPRPQPRMKSKSTVNDIGLDIYDSHYMEDVLYAVNKQDENGDILVEFNIKPLELEVISYLRKFSIKEQLEIISYLIDKDEMKKLAAENQRQELEKSLMTTDDLVQKIKETSKVAKIRDKNKQ